MSPILRVLAASLASSLLAAPSAARADAVTDWNAIAISSIATAVAGTPPVAGPPAFALDLAKVHAAVHDAVQAIERRYEPYHARVSGASGSSEAAAAKAAHDVLVALFPVQQAALDATYDAYFANHGLDPNDPGVAVGAAAAAALLALRANDGSFPAGAPPFVGSNEIGQWRPTPSLLPGPPPSFAPMVAPWAGSVTPFVVPSASQFVADLPPDVTSEEYAQDYREVKSRGALSNSSRSPEQTDLAYFYNDNFFAQWNRALRAIAASQNLAIADSARLFALANLAVADTFICVWATKLHYNYWRPISAIREGENDGNPATEGDPAWQPLINTPNYPDYSSGANGVVGATTRILRRFFGTDKLTFSVTSNAANVVQTSRTYTRLSRAAQDVVDARVYLGIHFRFADTASRAQGRRVADWVFRNALRPVE